MGDIRDLIWRSLAMIALIRVRELGEEFKHVMRERQLVLVPVITQARAQRLCGGSLLFTLHNSRVTMDQRIGLGPSPNFADAFYDIISNVLITDPAVATQDGAVVKIRNIVG